LLAAEAARNDVGPAGGFLRYKVAHGSKQIVVLDIRTLPDAHGDEVGLRRHASVVLQALAVARRDSGAGGPVAVGVPDQDLWVRAAQFVRQFVTGINRADGRPGRVSDRPGSAGFARPV